MPQLGRCRNLVGAAVRYAPQFGDVAFCSLSMQHFVVRRCGIAGDVVSKLQLVMLQSLRVIASIATDLYAVVSTIVHLHAAVSAITHLYAALTTITTCVRRFVYCAPVVAVSTVIYHSQ